MTEEESSYLETHSAHDFAALRSRWEALAAASGMEGQTLDDAGGYPALAYRTRPLAEGEAGDGRVLYLCAGVHGDEPAGPWGLLEWAERHSGRLRELPALILPCFNPWGLVHNQRADASGRDLNRLFHRDDIPVIRAWRELVGQSRFELALHLHEDFDARGIYLYELTESGLAWGEAALRACEGWLPRERRAEIDGSAFANGLLRREDGLDRVVEEELGGGYPEAIYLFRRHARSALTFETPSEHSLWRRVQAQRRFIEAALEAAGW